MFKLHTLKTCDTCRKAVKFLKARGIIFEEIPIREQPPTLSELRQLLATRNGELRALFNTSGADYKSLGMKARLPELSETEALELLATNGNLVKRPVLTGPGIVLNGFREAEWEAML